MSRHGTHQHWPPAGPILAALLACLLFMPVNAAAEQVGRVLVAVGGVTAEQADASARGLGRRDPIYAGDRIRTGARGRVQIRFEDGAMVDLDPGSTFEVEEYASDDDGGGSAVMSFLKGAMRTVTGAIGGNRSDNYRMNTTVATIGVRGTAYALEYCDPDCASRGGEVGLYGRVDAGTVAIDGPGGSGRFDQDQYFFVPEAGAPERIVVPPDGILEGGDAETSASEEEELADAEVRPSDMGTNDDALLPQERSNLFDPGYESAEDRDNDPDPETRPGMTTEGGFGGAFIGSSGFAAYRSPAEGDVRIDDEGRVVGAEFRDAGFIDASGLEHTGGSIEVVEFASETTFDVAWGAWASGSRSVEEDDIAGFVYTITDPANITTATEIDDLSASGTVAFYGDGGGPPAIGSGGDTWEISTLTLDVDFASAAIGAADIVLNPPEAPIETVFVSTTDVTSINTDGSFSVTDMTGSDLTETVQYEGDLEGSFLGTGAEGALVAFEVRQVGGEQRIVGSRVLTPQD